MTIEWNVIETARGVSRREFVVTGDRPVPGVLWQPEDELFSRAECLALFDALASSDKQIHAHPGAHAAVPAEGIDHSLDFLLRRMLALE